MKLTPICWALSTVAHTPMQLLLKHLQLVLMITRKHEKTGYFPFSNILVTVVLSEEWLKTGTPRLQNMQ